MGGLREEVIEPNDEKCDLTEQMTRKREPCVVAQGEEATHLFL